MATVYLGINPLYDALEYVDMHPEIEEYFENPSDQEWEEISINSIYLRCIFDDEGLEKKVDPAILRFLVRAYGADKPTPESFDEIFALKTWAKK